MDVTQKKLTFAIDDAPRGPESTWKIGDQIEFNAAEEETVAKTVSAENGE